MQLTFECSEKLGGHSLKNHFGQSDDFLRHRCTRGKVTAATVFDISQEDVLEGVKEILLENIDWLVEWLNDPDDWDFLEWDSETYPAPIGHGYFNYLWHRWREGPMPCDIIRVRVDKIDNHGMPDFVLKTVYPTLDVNSK